MTTNEPRTADFFTAIREAFERPGEWWWRRTASSYPIWLGVIGGVLVCGKKSLDRFQVFQSDLTATWTCDGSEP